VLPPTQYSTLIWVALPSSYSSSLLYLRGENYQIRHDAILRSIRDLNVTRRYAFEAEIGRALLACEKLYLAGFRVP
jgi:hypothetical protein